MQHHQGPGPEKNEPQPSQDGSPNLGNAELKLRGIPANSPAQALAIAEYQDSQARALRAARIEACERAERAAAIMTAENERHPPIPHRPRRKRPIQLLIGSMNCFNKSKNYKSQEAERLSYILPLLMTLMESTSPQSRTRCDFLEIQIVKSCFERRCTSQTTMQH